MYYLRHKDLRPKDLSGKAAKLGVVGWDAFGIWGAGLDYSSSYCWCAYREQHHTHTFPHVACPQRAFKPAQRIVSVTECRADVTSHESLDADVRSPSRSKPLASSAH